eukprot:scaffold50383_cov35-Tisochrysis_lutea.AAC.4
MVQLVVSLRVVNPHPFAQPDVPRTKSLLEMHDGEVGKIWDARNRLKHVESRVRVALVRDVDEALDGVHDGDVEREEAAVECSTLVVSGGRDSERNGGTYRSAGQPVAELQRCARRSCQKEE